MKYALIIIDMLNDFFKDAPMKNKKLVLSKKINELIEISKQKNVPIIFIRQEFKKDLSDGFLFMIKRNEKTTIKGTKGAQILSEINQNNDDIIITKKRFSAFYKTKLDNLLKIKKIDSLIIAGIFTHSCVRQTTIDAYQRDFNIILAKECIDSWDKKHHKITLDYLNYGLMMPLLSNNQIKGKI
ncbi:MAG: cysteine hydrolase [Nanoarchaeota archaeon]|nr:cysteine hydrolase [Nanoarchaeota archaeon]